MQTPDRVRVNNLFDPSAKKSVKEEDEEDSNEQETAREFKDDD